jgi:hypothetical protein
MSSPTRALLVACAVLFPGATLVSMAASGCESTTHIDVPVYEAGIPDTTLPPFPDTGAGDTATDAPADVAADASADAVPEAESTDAERMDGKTSDGASKDGRSDAEGSDARGEDAADARSDAEGDSSSKDAGEAG